MSGDLGIVWPSGLLGVILSLATRATLLMAVVLVARRVAGRRRPLIGSLLGHVGLLGLLVLPLATRFGPPLAFPLRPARPVAPIPLGPPAATASSRDVGEDQSPVADRAEVDVAPIDAGAGGLVQEIPAVVPARVHGPPPVPVRFEVDLASILVGVYLAGVVALLARLLGSLASIERLIRSSGAVSDPTWLDALHRLRERLSIARPVGLARSSRVGMPVVVGWRRPTIVLPVAEAGAPVEHAEAILLHELTHVRRGDYGWNVLLRLVTALYWPHPLAWLLGRAVAESRELACDAFCVHGMGGPAPYRATLLAMARNLARPGPALGLAMARRSRLARRVAAIDRTPGLPRCVPGRATRVAVTAAGLALAAVIGPTQITRAEPRPGTPAPAQEPQRAAEPARAPGSGRVFRLRVVAAATGKPVPRAQVRVWLKLANEDWREADEEGRIDIVHSTGPSDDHLVLDIWGDGFAMQRHYWGEDPKVPIPAEATVKLQPGESLGGLVQDEAGRPVAGAYVYLWSHNYKHKDPTELLYDLRAMTGPDGRWHTGGAPATTGEILGFYITHPDFISDREYVAGRERPPIAALCAGTAVSTLKKGVPIEGRVFALDGQPVADALVISTESPGNLFNGLDKFAVTTDAAGRFRTGQVGPGEWHLVVRADGFAPAARKVKVGPAIPSEEIRLTPPRRLQARVVDPAGNPVAGAFLNIDTWHGYRCLGVYLYSDADGRVRWDDAPADDLIVSVDREGYLGLSSQKVQAGGESTFTLRPALRISGIVRDAATKKGIGQATIEYGAVDPTTGEVANWQSPPEIGPVWYSGGYLTANFPVAADASKIRITADGYLPFVSRAFRREERVVVHYDVALTPGRAADEPVATAFRPDGRPLAGARIVRGQSKRGISLYDGRANNQATGGDAVTAADGTFVTRMPPDKDLVLLLGDDCFACANAKALADSPRLQARSYGRVEGRFLVGDRPHANGRIELSGRVQDESTNFEAIAAEQTATTDAEGRFAFERVIPMRNLRIARRDDPKAPNRVWSIGEAVQVEDGRTTVATIGGKGWAVVGRVLPPEGRKQPVDFTEGAEACLETNQPNTPYPLEVLRGKTSLNDPGWMEWSRAWPTTPEGQAYNEAFVRVRVALAADGSFRFDDIPPGEYRVTIGVNEPQRARERGPFAALVREVEAPPLAGDRGVEPLDLGAFPLRPRVKPRVGEPAPRFEVTTVAGRKLAIPGDFAGKFLLLDFGTMWDDQSRLQVVRMNDIQARFGKDDRFALLSLLMAADRPESRAFVAEKGQPWPQAIAGPVDNPITDAYGIEGSAFPGPFPAAVLIGPDGRIVADDLRYNAIGDAIDKALKQADAGPRR